MPRCVFWSLSAASAGACRTVGVCRFVYVDLSRLLMVLEVEASKQREFKDASVKIVEFLAGIVEGDDCGFQLGFAFRFLVCCVSMPWRSVFLSFQAR